MEEPISNKNERNEAWDFQRRFQVKPNYGSTRNFRMRVPLPYCNSGIGLFCFDGEFKCRYCTAQGHYAYTALQYLLRYLPNHRLLRVLWGKQKAPRMNLHNHLASRDWRFNYFSKLNLGAEALQIDISVLTHYRHVTNQIFSFAFPVRYDLNEKSSSSHTIGHSQDTSRTLTYSMLPHPLFAINISAPPSTPRIPFRQFHFTMFYNRFQ